MILDPPVWQGPCSCQHGRWVHYHTQNPTTLMEFTRRNRGHESRGARCARDYVWLKGEGCGCVVGWAKNTPFLNFNLLIRILGQNILETNQKKNQPKILMFNPPWGGQHFAIQLILKIFQESSKCTYLHTNRRRILRWFQKCILLYHYLEYLTSYSSFSVKIGHFTPRVTNLALEMQ